MTRSFNGQAVDLDLLEELCELSLRAPTAGNAAGVRCIVIGHDDVAAYFDTATDEEWRARSPKAAGLLRAGAVVLVTSRPQDYLQRYGEPDKATSGLHEAKAWPLPYWHTDAAMATMALLLLLEEAGLGVTLWGAFRHVADIATFANFDDEELFASLIIGYPDGLDTATSSLRRATTLRSARVRRLGRSSDSR
jgi:nitroreductase